MADQGKKVGRNIKKCASYRTAQRHEFNKARRIVKYLKKFPTNKANLARLEELKKVLYTAQRKALGISL